MSDGLATVRFEFLSYSPSRVQHLHEILWRNGIKYDMVVEDKGNLAIKMTPKELTVFQLKSLTVVDDIRESMTFFTTALLRSSRVRFYTVIEPE